MTNYILDTNYVKQLEKAYDYKFSKEELDEARFNEGHLSTIINGRWEYFHIPVLVFPNDLIDYDNEEQPW